MVEQAPKVFIPEDASTSRPPSFDGKFFYNWKGILKLFLESQDEDLWDIIQIGPFIPKKRNQAGGEIDKPKEEWTIEEMLTRFTTIVNERNALGEKYTTHQRIKKILRSLPKICKPKVITIIEAKNLKTLVMDELICSLKVHEKELIDEIQLPKGNIINLKGF